MSSRRLAWVDLIPAVLAAAVLAKVGGGWWARVAHPYDLEWMEGGMLAHAWRLLRGQPLYPDAGPEWIPYIYPPGYPALLASLSPLVGLDYAPARAVSIAGTLVAAAALAATVARRGSWMVGLACAGAFLGCWRASGAFYDLVRPDGLAIGLLALVLLLVRVGAEAEANRGAQITAGVLLALAFTVKHHVAALGVPLALALWLGAGRSAATRFVLASAVPGGLFALVMAVSTQGRFLQYLLVVPGTHPWEQERLFPGMFGEVAAWLLPAGLACGAWALWRSPAAKHGVPWPWLMTLPAVLGGAAAVAVFLAPEVRGSEMPPLAVAAALSGAIGAGLGAVWANAIAAFVARPSLDREDRRWWSAVAVFGTVLVVALAMRAHNGGFLNVLIPFHYAICLGVGLVVVDLRRTFPGLVVEVATSLGLALQVGWLWWRTDTASVVPSAQDVEAGAEVVARLRECPPGPILSPFAAWLPVQAGREPSVHLIALWDVYHVGNPFLGAAEAVDRAAAEHRWGCVLTGARQRLGFGIEDNYRVESTFSFDARALTTKTGWRVRPFQVLVPKESAP